MNDRSTDADSSTESTHRRACAVCAWPLSHDDVNGFYHERETLQDHVVVPVPYSELLVNQCCDVCDRGATHWLPADDFVMGHPAPDLRAVLPDRRSIGAWALCPECVLALHQHGIMDGLYRRAKFHVFTELRTRRTPDSTAMIYDTYRALNEAAHVEQLQLLDPTKTSARPGPHSVD